jgi:predicted porin
MKRKIAFLCAALGTCVAHAQSNVTIYGIVDEYVGYIKNGNGTNVTSLNDGGLLKSRIGFRGQEDLGGGYKATFTLENGFNGNTGAQAQGTRLFDRQAWVGIATPGGEFRVGRQATEIFFTGLLNDYTGRTTYGSVMNDIGNPTQYDNDISYRSPRIANFQTAVHYALSEKTGEGVSGGIFQFALDYLNGPFRVGYAGLEAKPDTGAVFTQSVQYHNAYFNYQYGHGTIYLGYVRTNNVTNSANGNNAATILSNISIPTNSFAGSDANVRRFYNIYQISADYEVTSALKVGALLGELHDTSSSNASARGGSVGAFYALSKRTTLYSVASYLKNSAQGGFRFSGSGAPSGNLAGADINGQSLLGVQFGILHRF